MKIVIVHGQNHKGSTYMVSRNLVEKIEKRKGKGVEKKEFFLPADFDESCIGCFTCFQTDLSNCPHYQKLEPIKDAILDADLLILDSPVYVYHATGQMMSLLDHFGTWWVVHRPEESMLKKRAVVLTTAAGGGMKSTLKDMADSLEMWGISKIYRYGVGVQAAKPEEIPERISKKIQKKTDKLAAQICKQSASGKMNKRAKMWFGLMRLAHKYMGASEADYAYWEEKGWHK